MWWRKQAEVVVSQDLPVVRADSQIRSLDALRRRIAETASWCHPRADASRPADCLRDPDLQPRRLEEDYFAAVGTVASRRSSRLGRAFPATDPSRGRLLVYFPDADLCDGAAEVESGGFFDVYNTPPWDTWIAFFQDAKQPQDAYVRYLIAWVPPQLEELVGRGIEVNPEQCIAWLEDTNCAMRDVLAGEAGRTA